MLLERVHRDGYTVKHIAKGHSAIDWLMKSRGSQ
jgi:hypothetical protein